MEFVIYIYFTVGFVTFVTLVIQRLFRKAKNLMKRIMTTYDKQI